MLIATNYTYLVVAHHCGSFVAFSKKYVFHVECFKLRPVFQFLTFKRKKSERSYSFTLRERILS